MPLTNPYTISAAALCCDSSGEHTSFSMWHWKTEKNILIFKYLLQNHLGRYQVFLVFYFYFLFCFCNYIKIVQLYLLNKEYLRIKLTLSEFGANILKQKAHKNSSVHIEEIQALLVFKRIQLHKPKGNLHECINNKL